MAENTQDKRNRKVIIDFVNSTIGNINNKDITLVKHPCIAEAELLEGLCGAVIHSMNTKDQKYSYVSKVIDTTFIYIRNSADELLEKSKTTASMNRLFTIKMYSLKRDKPYIIDIFYILNGNIDKNYNIYIYYSAMDSNENISDYISDIDYISIDAGFVLSNDEDESKLIIIDDKSSEIFIDIRDNTESVSAFISNIFNYVIDIYLDILQEIVYIEEKNVDNYDAITDNDDIEEVIEEDQEESDYENNNTSNEFKVFTREIYLPDEDIIIPDPNFVNETYKFYNDINVEDMLGLENTIPGISKALMSMDKNNKVNLYNAGVTLLEFIFSENKDKYIRNKEQMGYDDVIVSLAYDKYCMFIIIDTKNKKLYLHTNITERVFNKLLSLDLDITDIQINIGYRIMKDGQASYEKCVMQFSDKFNSRSLSNHETCCIKNIFNRETIFDIFLKCIGEAMINVANINNVSSTNSNYGLEPYIIYDHNFNTILKTIEDSGVFDNLSKDMYGALKFILNDKTDNNYLKYLQNRKFVEKDESLYHTISNNGDNIMITFINKINIIDSCGNIQTAVNTQEIPFGNFTIIKSNKMVTLPESTYTKSGQVTKDMLKIVKYMEYVNNDAEGQ